MEFGCLTILLSVSTNNILNTYTKGRTLRMVFHFTRLPTNSYCCCLQSECQKKETRRTAERHNTAAVHPLQPTTANWCCETPFTNFYSLRRSWWTILIVFLSVSHRRCMFVEKTLDTTHNKPYKMVIYWLKTRDLMCLSGGSSYDYTAYCIRALSIVILQVRVFWKMKSFMGRFIRLLASFVPLLLWRK